MIASPLGQLGCEPPPRRRVNGSLGEQDIRGAADVLHQVEAREDDVQATFVRSDERTQENADHVGAWRHSARSPSSSGAARAPAAEATAPASAAGAHPKNDDVTAYV